MIWTGDNTSCDVKVLRKETHELMALVTKIDTEKRELTRLKLKEGAQEHDPKVLSDYEEVIEDLGLFRVEGLPIPSEHGYKAPWKTHDKNEAFWREVLVGKTIKDLEFVEDGIEAFILDDGQRVFLVRGVDSRSTIGIKD